MNRCVETHLASDVCKPRKLISGFFLTVQEVPLEFPVQLNALHQMRSSRRCKSKEDFLFKTMAYAGKRVRVNGKEFMV